MKAKQLPMVRVTRGHGEVVVSFEVKSIDEQNFSTIVDELEELARSPIPQSVIIDLTGVRRVDELGLLVLQSFKESIKEVGGTAAFCGPTHQIEGAVPAIRLAKEIDNRDSRSRSSQSTQW